MSRLTNYLDKPASIAADAAIAVGIGVVAYVLIGLIKGILPFGENGSGLPVSVMSSSCEAIRASSSKVS